jgi:sodium transport system permease protein
MIRDAFIIFRKELRNLLKDRRTVFSTLILPLLTIPIIFVGMGSVLGSLDKEARETIYTISIQDNTDRRLPAILSTLVSYVPVSIEASPDVTVIFPRSYAPGTKAVVRMVYDSSSQKTQFAAQMVRQALRQYDDLIAQELLVSHGLSLTDLTTLETVVIDTAPEAVQSGGGMLAMMVPYFLIIFLFAGSMSTGLDVTCGEKERGSLAALLVNQVSRTSIAWGKILHVMTVATASSIATFAGMLISLQLPGGSGMFGGMDVGASSIGSTAMLVILLALFSTALLTASLISLLGCLAKTVKEGTAYVMPLYMVVVLIGVTTMYMDPSKNSYLFLIPFVNTIFALKESFMGMVSTTHVLLMIGTNLLYAAVCGFLVSRLFNSERILQTV